jgi:hypothetical protein
MDDIVAQAMQKWPNVPDVYGWLGLDRRGNWLLRGERIGNVALNAFISRNYMADALGRWYFQNGPQRVFAELALTPFVYFLHRAGNNIAVTAQTGTSARRVDAVFLTSDGNLILDTELGPGLILDRDLAIALESLRDANGKAGTEDALAALRRGENSGVYMDFSGTKLTLETIEISQLATRFHFDPTPEPLATNS